MSKLSAWPLSLGVSVLKSGSAPFAAEQLIAYTFLTGRDFDGTTRR
jgi:hypothetical protein